MKVKNLEIKNFGSVKNFKCGFNRQVTVFVGYDYDSLLAALGLATLNGIFYGLAAGKISYGKDVYIAGTFEFAGDEYRTEYFYSQTLKNGDFFVDENFCGRLYKNGEVVDFEDYQEKLLAAFDDNEPFWFNNDYMLMPNTAKYINFDRKGEDVYFFAKEMIKEKAPYNTHYLQKIKEFVQKFEPVFIKDCIDYKIYLHFDNKYFFECVRHYEDGRIEKDEYLSDQDNTLFIFSCFSAVARYMQTYNQSVGLAKKPVFVFKLLGNIGWGTDASAVINQVAETNCNVFVFEPFGVDEHQQGISNFQFIKVE